MRPRRKKETREMEVQSDFIPISNEASNQTYFVLFSTEIGTQNDSKIQMIDFTPSLVAI